MLEITQDSQECARESLAASALATSDLLLARQQSAVNRLRPIFVVGAARSGTTMLGSILGSARGSIATPESQFIADLISKAQWPGGLLDPEIARSTLAASRRFQIWGIDEQTLTAGSREPKAIAQVVESLLLAYTDRVGTGRKEFWVDHTPESLFILPYLAEMFPDSKFIHLVRDGRAVGASILPLDAGPVDIFDAAVGWCCQVATGLAAEGSPLLAGRIKRVHYEAILSDPTARIAELCHFCDVPFEDEMVEGKGFSVPPYTRDQHSLVGSRPQVARASSWKTSLSSRQVEIFESQAGALLHLLGYSTVFWPNATRRTAFEAWSSRLRKLILRPYNRARRRARLQRQLQSVKKPVAREPSQSHGAEERNDERRTDAESRAT